jgi:glutathione synthase/RimK-type ligase-like ATP-grasp enzyme
MRRPRVAGPAWTPFLETTAMKKIGVMVGRERSFPDAFIAEVNRRSAKTTVTAEYVRTGATVCGSPPAYAVILDRISHEVPYYQVYLKHAALHGVHVVNNPFWKLADDKFFGTALATRLGVPVPRSVALPNREYIRDITPDSLRSLELVDWEGVLRTTGVPAYIKPLFGGGWKSVSRVGSVEELLHAYNESGQLTMIVQEGIQWSAYVRCIVIGGEHVYPHLWDPTLPHHERYRGAKFEIPPALMASIVEMSKKLCRALGYDMNTCEFAVRDGVPYAIDFMNAAPDLDKASLTDEAFDWAVRTMADTLIGLADKKPRLPEQWGKLMFPA